MRALFHALSSNSYRYSETFLSTRLRDSLHRYSIDKVLLCYRTEVTDTARTVVPRDEDLKYFILFEAHDTSLGV